MKPAKSKLIDKIAVNNEKHMKKRMKRFRIAESEKKKRNERLLKDSFNFSLSGKKPREEEGLSIFDEYVNKDEKSSARESGDDSSPSDDNRR